MAAAAAGASLGGSNRNPRGNGPSLRPPGKAVALADITNTGRPDPPRSVNVADVLKENAKLVHLLGEKTKIIEASTIEMHKLRIVLHATRKQNVHLAQTNTQLLAELNQRKDRIQALEHELSCTTAALKLKASEVEQNNETANQLQKEVISQEEIEAMPSKLAPVEAQADNKETSVNVHDSVKTQPAVPYNTVVEEPSPDKTTKREPISRRTSKRKSDLCITKDMDTVQHSSRSHLQSTVSLHHEDTRKTLQRRSTRLNPGPCEVSEVSCETLHNDTAIPSITSSTSVPKLNEPNIGKETGNSTQDKLLCTAAVHKLKASELKKNKTSEQPQKKDVSVEEDIQEACSGVAGIEGLVEHQIDDNASNPDHLAETRSSLLFNIQHPEPPEERANKRKPVSRGANKRKLESCEGRKDLNTKDDINAKFLSTSIELVHHEETRKSRKKSSRLNPRSSEVTDSTSETVEEDSIAPSAPSISTVLVEEKKDDMQNDCRSSIEPSEEQAAGGRSSVEVTGRRSSMRAAGKNVSYKEIPVNVKMRRP